MHLDRLLRMSLASMLSSTRGRNLGFSTGVEAAIADADMVFISVIPHEERTGRQASDLRGVEVYARTVAQAAKGHTIVVE